LPFEYNQKVRHLNEEIRIKSFTDVRVLTNSLLLLLRGKSTVLPKPLYLPPWLGGKLLEEEKVDYL
jgi:hypothetical protein